MNDLNVMELKGHKYLALNLFVVLSLTGVIDCAKDKYDPSFIYNTGRFVDIAQAINFMQGYLPFPISFEEKCERYAVLSDIALEERIPTKETVLKIAGMSKRNLDEHYEQINKGRRSWLYMCAIDRYRITNLAPPFLELVECLKQIDEEGVRRYLDNEEVIILLNLYKRVIGLQPDVAINISNLDLTRFHPNFRESLKNHFSKYSDIASILGEPEAKRTETATNSSEWRKEQFKRRRREQSRLTAQRMRMVKPERMKRYNDERRERYREQASRLSQPASTPEELADLAKLKERRDRRNENQRNKRREARERMRLERRREWLEKNSEPPLLSRNLINYDNLMRAVEQEPLPSLRVSSDQSRSSSTPVNSATSAPMDPSTSYMPRPLSPYASLDSTASTSEMDVHMLDNLIELYHSLPADAELQHMCQDYNDLMNQATGDRQNQWEHFQSTLLSFEPNSIEERQFHEELMECAARWDNSSSILEFLLDEPPTTVAPASLNQGVAE